MGSRLYLPFLGVVLCICICVCFCACLCAFTTDGCWLMVELAIFVFLLCICCGVCMYPVFPIPFFRAGTLRNIFLAFIVLIVQVCC